MNITQQEAAQLLAAATETNERLERIERTLTAMNDDGRHVRGVVDRLDALVVELTAKVRGLKLPKFLQGMVD